MALFVRQLNDSSIGASLRSLRKRQGISLDMVARTTQIQRKHLEAFEKNAFHLLPDPIYARHFLRQFVVAINGDAEYFIARFDEECGTCSAVTDKMRVPRQRIGRRLLRQWRSILIRVSLGLVALALVGYVAMQLVNLVSPPSLLVDSPHGDIQTASASLVVAGQTETEVQVHVNSELVLTDPTGRFETQITLTRGLNIIEIEAKKKYGRANTVIRTVFLEDLRPTTDQ